MAPFDRELLLQDQRVQTHYHAQRQNRSKLRRHDPRCRRRDPLKMNLNRPESKRLETLSSLAVRAIASPSKGATEITRILLDTRIASVAWMVSVRTISLSREADIRATAPPERTPCVI